MASDSASTPDYLQLILNARVYSVAKETPLTHAVNLSKRMDANIYLKREDLQPVFSFKLRGAYNKMAHLPAEKRAKGVVACSAGNHAQGVALAAKALGCPATIVMPVMTPSIKVNAVQHLGASIVLCGNDFDGAKREALRLAEEQDLTMIAPFDDPLVIAGQGTIGMEIIKQVDAIVGETRDPFQPAPDAIFCCVGGGGLLAGVSAFVKRVRPQCKVIGVETFDADAMTQSIAKGDRVELQEVGLFADGAAVRLVGEHTYRVVKDNVDEMVSVTTDEICAAIKDTFEDTRSILEPAGALGLAGLKKYIATDPDRKGGVYVAVCSGANMNFDRLRFVADRAEIGEKREALMCVTIPEKPGSFVALYRQLYPRGVSEFSYRYHHQEKAQIFLGFKVKDKSEIAEVQKSLNEVGMDALDLTDNELAKAHARYLAGGRSTIADERLLRFEFPERPGALKRFLDCLHAGWNVSLFHYRNQGGDVGKVLVGIQVPETDSEQFNQFLQELGYRWIDETDNPIYQQFLR